MQCLEPETQRKTKMRWNLFIICLAAFFTGGSMFLFITCVTDYVGKVLYGGDPEADPESEEYELYGQGLRTGSLGMLILNLAYVAFSLVHRRVLSFLGPKKEYLLVSAFVIGLLLSLQLTDDMAVYYVTSGVMGLNRAVLYTIPFMLANQQCHQDETSQLEHGHGHGRVGSTMALVTCALPCAFLVVCAIAGPLIDATGDPGAPMILSIGFCAVASFTFVFYKP
ncbi:hypothetical protein BaRGS_00023401 [Batillaria attramentaria]|uniref:Uncharacterized protein n=1 Tax=Batillaria attramentaria TaxID=370345 RepID=A0ABD0KEE1_9CAEN